jgi:putative Holliday junction resolvase
VTSATRDPRALTTLLAFDYGERRIGVAVGQTISATASPVRVFQVRNGRPDWPIIDQLITDWRPDALIIGLPLNMDGTPHDLAPKVERFANRLRNRYRLPIYFADERLSSHEGAQRRATPREQIDAYAAQVILESWLNEYGERA